MVNDHFYFFLGGINMNLNKAKKLVVANIYLWFSVVISASLFLIPILIIYIISKMSDYNLSTGIGLAIATHILIYLVIIVPSILFLVSLAIQIINIVHAKNISEMTNNKRSFVLLVVGLFVFIVTIFGLFTLKKEINGLDKARILEETSTSQDA